MATQRMVQTSLWRKSRKFKQCDPLERLLYLYILTNEDTELCGAYELELDEIALHTGLDYRMLPQMFEHLEEIGLATYRDGWVIIANYKATASNPKVRKGIEDGLERLPDWVRGYIYRLTAPIDSASSSMTDSDSDSDSDNDVDSDTRRTRAEPEHMADPDPDDQFPSIPPDGGSGPPATRELSAMKDPVADLYQTVMTRVLPVEGWANVGKERRHLAELAKKTRALRPKTPFEDDVGFAKAILAQYQQLIRHHSGSEYWRNAPFSPSGLATRWDKVTTALATDYENAMAWRTA